MKKIGACLLVGLLAFPLTHFISTSTRVFSGMERGLLDGFFYIREPATDQVNPYVSDRSLLLGCDEDAIAVIGKWPWKRYVHGEFLERIQRFSPESVLFDVIFADQEKVPSFIVERRLVDPGVLDVLEKAYSEMDDEFARALARYDNVYIDLQLMEHPRGDLPEEFKERVHRNELAITDYSLPAENAGSPVLFSSLEPILGGYIDNAHPVVINVFPDEDGKVRFFPLYYTYRMGDGSLRNVFSAALSLAIRYYKVTRDDVEISPGKVLLRGAKIPVRHRDTRQPRVFVKDFRTLRQMTTNPRAPDNYRYNRDLHRLMLNRLVLGYEGGGRIPLYPLHLLERENGSFEILDGWEIFDAAAAGGAEKVSAVLYREQNLTLETPIGSFFYINYAGREESFHRDSESGGLKSHRPIPTGSYRDVYSLPDLPDLPALSAGGNIREDFDRREIERWFIELCAREGRAAYEAARNELGKGAEDEDLLVEFMNRNPRAGKYFFYHFFLTDMEARPGEISSTYELYAEFARQMEQDSAFHLNDRQMVSTLMEDYRRLFDRYYNKFVFTGATAAGLGDVQQTPYSAMSGVNVIINAFNTLATGHPLRMSVHVPRLDFIVLLTASLLFCLLYGLTDIRLSGIIFLVLLISTFLVSLTLFNTRSFFLRTTPLVFANAVIFVGMVMYKLLTEEKDRKFLKATFRNYLSPELIEAMHEARTMPKLGGEAKVITAYFTDIQDFSAFSEKLTAEQLVELLNEYLSAMTEILIENNGTLDKYEGDAIVAFFGAPVSLPDHAYRACRVAVAMQETLGELREKWRRETEVPGSPSRNVKNLPPEDWRPGEKWPVIAHNMRMRVGINTGEIVVGNMGSSMRMNYTMMGDAVNVAARLEAAAKHYGVYTLISYHTLETPVPVNESSLPLRELVEARLIDHITVVGKSEPVKVYELCALKGGLNPEETRLLEIFERGIGHYMRMEWDRAIEVFGNARAIERFPENGITPSDVYLRRCTAYKEKPPVAPGEVWAGVHSLTVK